MKFLGGFLKFLGFLIILIGTIGGTALCVFGIMEEIWEPCLVGGLVFLGCLFVSLGILGTGIALKQIVKLKKRVEQLEQRLYYAPAAAPEVIPQQSITPEVPAPVQQETAPSAEIAPAKFNMKRWMPVIIASVLVVVALIVVIAFVGGDKDHITEEVLPPQEVLPPVEMAEPEPTEGPAQIEVAELPMGTSLSTAFVDMTFDNVIIEEDIQHSVTVDNVTRVTGPEPLPGQLYICLSGKIINTSKSELPVYDFFNGRFQIGDYTYEVTANDCDVLSAYGDPESTIDPLMEYDYRIYTAIPAAMAEMVYAGEPYSFTFGFYDDFANEDLSYNRSFGDDPIAECPYQFFIPFQ